ncbi:FAD-dependent thymidylate synthase [Streptomyces sp. NBC_01356]|uniref:FAD-dependent thymidylate synthase n=1 Tax=Streptomyces sp. NBC_01356 TaxID=2903836 RepID=UPI002E36C75B|nr:FAD-dependent thymidylate synthase [Streptomyces sp. NBC_01356]
MKVEILAETMMWDYVLGDAYDYRPSGAQWNADEPTDLDALGEAAGRICYKSFRRPNPATASNANYLANILGQGHFSVLEHASVTFLVRDVSRSLLAELTRHRHLSFSVVSQRYVNYAETDPVIPPAADTEAESLIRYAYANSRGVYVALVSTLEKRGLSRKQAREAARSVLPNAAPVDMVVTGNLRAWRDVLGKRHSTHADAEIQGFAAEVLAKLRSIAPNSVQDIAEEPSE